MTTTVSEGTVTDEAAAQNRKYATVVYALYGAGFIFVVTALAGLVLAYIQREKADALTRTHYDFQIRTFWFGAPTLLFGFFTMLFLIGYLIMLWWAVWTLVRVIKGYMALNEGKPIENPKTWLW